MMKAGPGCDSVILCVSVGVSTEVYSTVSSGDRELTRELLEWLPSGAHFDLDPVSGLTVSTAVESPFGL
jgi:hypothetical protein